MLFRIKKGLDIPVGGAPEQVVSDGPPVTSVALLGQDYIGLRPALLVAEGDRVKLGQALFADRRHPDLQFTAPGAGVVRQINRGPRRSLVSVVIALEGDEAETFATPAADSPTQPRSDQVMDLLLASGLWTAFRTRPYSKVPDPRSEPHSIFVTAMDSNPLSAKAEVVIAGARDDFSRGLAVVSRLTEGPVYLCTEPGADIPEGDPGRITMAAFAGPHPAGLAGTHIHVLDPAGHGKTVWQVGYQDVMAIGRLFATGRLPVERIVALGGPLVRRPRLVRACLGANTGELTEGETSPGARRVVSGSVLAGHRATGTLGYLGRYHTQVAVLAEAPKGERPAWGRAGVMVPLESFERVMPMDIPPVPLLRALLVGDTDVARALGGLELDEEDLALLSYLCPGGNDYGPLLRACLAQIERHG